MGDFAVDLAKAYSIVLADRAHLLRARLGLLLLNSELHCVACYRYGRYCQRLRKRNPVLGSLALVVHRIWNRWVTHIHHCEISSAAEIGPGLLIMHRHGVLLGPVEIGSNCVLHQNTTLGQRVAGGDQGVPRIGDNVWIGPGAIITGGVTVGEGVTISAGTVLSRDVPDGCLVGGNPGRVIARDYDNQAILNYVVPEALGR